MNCWHRIAPAFIKRPQSALTHWRYSEHYHTLGDTILTREHFINYWVLALLEEFLDLLSCDVSRQCNSHRRAIR